MEIYRDLSCWPPDIPDKSPFFMFPEAALQKRDEKVVTYMLLSDRRLFGSAYGALLPDYFKSMPQDSGVMIGSFIKTEEITRDIKYPGDIDVLVIPYEGSKMVLSKMLAIEIKVIRATFERQGKSPNQFGFSQANGLLKAGFPYAAVGHLIVSDCSPVEAWRDIGITTILDSKTGKCSPVKIVKFDMLPIDLLNRAHGRLESNCNNPLIGYFSAYPGSKGVLRTPGRSTSLNPLMKIDLIENAYNYYVKNYSQFLWTRRYPSAYREKPLAFEDYMPHLIEKMKKDF